jgi:Carboxypeptidase regulatory-like domain
VRQKAAISAWPGSVQVEIRPAPGTDGIGTVASKVTNPSPGVWHYEYAIYNQNIDRGIASFSVPTGAGVTLSNIGFRSPPQHPGATFDGTVGNLGFSSAPWATSQAGGALTWSTESFAQNQNANAIRWGTMYNFRFDSNRPPTTINATVGFFKTGAPITVQVQAPSPAAAVNVSVSGRVTSQSGRGLGGVTVYITDSQGASRTAITNPFGFYTIEGIITGQSYTVGVNAKRYSFPAPTNMPINDNVSNLNFVALP